MGCQLVSQFIRYTIGPTKKANGNQVGMRMLEATVWGKREVVEHVPYVELDHLPGVSVSLGPGLHQKIANSLIDGDSLHTSYTCHLRSILMSPWV
jgi:hypothetical protein